MKDFMYELAQLSSADLSRLKESVEKEMENREKNWDAYIKYLREWATDHAEIAYSGQSPVCFDEFCDNDLHVDEEA